MATSDLQTPNPSNRIAVIITTYNRASALITCLEHLERQTMADFEVIVVNDGATDDTEARMMQYALHTPLRLRYVRQQNAGPAKARNLAISMAESALCVMIGDDIFASPDFVAAHVRFHQQNPGQPFAALGLTRWSNLGQTVTPFMRWLDEGGVQFAYHDLLRGAPPNWSHFYTSNLSLKTTMLRQNPFNESFTKESWMMEDMELGYRLERTRDLQLRFLPDAVAEHLHPTTFRQTCQRFFGAGLSSRVFERLWPERQPLPRSAMRRQLAAFVRWNRWLLRVLTAFTDALTRVWCPNPLLRPVLALHASMGYNQRTPSRSPRP